MSDPFMLPVEDDPFNFARYADPYPNYRRVRETTPVYWSQLLGGWVLTRHADVKTALLDKRLSAARTRDAQAAQLSEDLRRQLAPVDELLRRWALFQDEPLSEVEILSQCMLLLHGGYESTMNTISSGMLHILRDPDQRRLCAEDPGLVGAAVEEALRYEPAFQFVARAATADLDIGGQA